MSASLVQAIMNKYPTPGYRPGRSRARLGRPRRDRNGTQSGGRARRAYDDEACLAVPERPGAEHHMTGKVAVITGASQGIGAGLVVGYRERGWAVVATARMIKPSEDPGLLTVAGDIADPATAETIIRAALHRFGRIATLVNNAGVDI